MKFVVDMNLSPGWVKVLSAAGWEAMHWSETGMPRAIDATILDWARSRGYIVFTHDLDFGAILAATGAAGPSVIQVRADDVLPETLGDTVSRGDPPIPCRARAGRLDLHRSGAITGQSATPGTIGRASRNAVHRLERSGSGVWNLRLKMRAAARPQAAPSRTDRARLRAEIARSSSSGA